MCVNSHSPFPALSERNWLYGAVFFYYDLSGLRGTLHPQGWICSLNKVGQEGKVVRRLQNWQTKQKRSPDELSWREE